MVNVIKADGTIEPYQREKVLDSIKRAGIPRRLQDEVLKKIESDLHEDITTSQIYKHIEDFLGRSDEPYLKGRYSLKQAIMALGPTGYPFEFYVSEILKEEGFKTEVGVMLRGKCVTHEVDVVAKKGNEKLMVEAKFHNRTGTKSDIQVALYTSARFDDLSHKHGFTKALLVTNTKITKDALDYAHCQGMQVLGWSYPGGESLRDLVEKYKLFPITILTSLSFSQKQTLLNAGIVLAREICFDKRILNKSEVPDNIKERVSEEAGFICNL